MNVPMFAPSAGRQMPPLVSDIPVIVMTDPPGAEDTCGPATNTETKGSAAALRHWQRVRQDLPSKRQTLRPRSRARSICDHRIAVVTGVCLLLEVSA